LGGAQLRGRFPGNEARQDRKWLTTPEMIRPAITVEQCETKRISFQRDNER